MKMLVIAVDGHGGFRCGLVKNPDLFRRKIAAETGSGYIVWAAIPILATNSAESLSHIQDHVLPRFTAQVQLQHDRTFVMAMAWAWLGRPLLGYVARNRRWRVSRVARCFTPLKLTLAFKGRHQGDRP
ncbi:hypothetical protein [Devosia salina]|uniref:Uncharacterized protein n=1 Tax=Devosia salina TaxID=2860336 RepID=A0ABX8WDQ2_9HYPH|nr:hypothetical protein [Devosia salina]QYO75096.1 hypothetical protein K1X15_10485 [Devosia salina]